MKRALAILALILIAAAAQAQQEPDYSAWTALLQKYYDPARGMDYAALKARDGQTLQSLRNGLAKVNVAALNRKQQLAYWINVYNINSVATIVENYPVKSIRDISTDPIIRLNVFKKDRVPFGGGKLSLNDVENDKIREGFHDPRIHFAINCAAKSCPPIRPEAFTGAQLDAQLDDQARKFLGGVRISGNTAHVTKIMDWFGEDFDKWGGGKSAFLRRYLPAEKQRALDQAGSNIDFSYDDYDWSLNDWRR
ncbi:MAG TPA: DUF547 domain-containing protein [Thermoanaerobaculia bacterium]|jgi:hypothetical protein|nr:DUF547 domain-containing protein [Thermoanaerobaculia bacterium]